MNRSFRNSIEKLVISNRLRTSIIAKGGSSRYVSTVDYYYLPYLDIVKSFRRVQPKSKLHILVAGVDFPFGDDAITG